MLSETVTFGDSGLDRAAQLRADLAAAVKQSSDVRCVKFWRGRPLYLDDSLSTLCYAEYDPSADDAQIFVGRDENGVLIFACDTADWSEIDTQKAAQAGNFDREIYLNPNMPNGAVFADLRMGMAQLCARDAEIAAMARGLFAWHENHQFCAYCGERSVMAMAGWQRDCPACGRCHFPRTDPVVIMLITHGNSVLIGRSPGWPDGMYSLLAGFVEPGETIEAAVRREVFEEAGVRVDNVSYLCSQPWPFPSSLMLGCKGTAQDRVIKIDPVELEDALWLSREEMAEAYAGGHPHIKPARKGSIAHFLLREWLADRA